MYLGAIKFHCNDWMKDPGLNRTSFRALMTIDLIASKIWLTMLLAVFFGCFLNNLHIVATMLESSATSLNDISQKCLGRSTPPYRLPSATLPAVEYSECAIYSHNGLW